MRGLLKKRIEIITSILEDYRQMELSGELGSTSVMVKERAIGELRAYKRMLKDMEGIEMTEVIIYGVNKNGNVEYVGEADNSWAGAMHVWGRISKKYALPGGLFGYQALWNAVDKGILQPFENMVVKSTFDDMIVEKKDIPELLQAYAMYDTEYPGSNLAEQAEIITEEILNNEDMIGVCWNQTSVNSNPWTNGYDEEEDEPIPYNMLTGTRHRLITEVRK